MQGPLRNLPQWPASSEGVSVLAISSEPRDHANLRGIFSHTRWRIFEASNCHDAVHFLARTPVGVLICDSSLPDGNWRELLTQVSRSPASPLMIVASMDADDAVWAEALNLGAYDVLSKPFDLEEVTRVVSLAWLHWRERRNLAGKNQYSSQNLEARTRSGPE